MTLDEIKKMVENEGGKIIIIEGGKPVLVIASFEEYKNKLKSNWNYSPRLSGELNLKRDIPKELDDEDLKIEDLPV